MSKTPQPKNSCSECGKAIFNDGGKCVKCLSTPVKKQKKIFNIKKSPKKNAEIKEDIPEIK